MLVLFVEKSLLLSILFPVHVTLIGNIPNVSNNVSATCDTTDDGNKNETTGTPRMLIANRKNTSDVNTRK